MARVERENASLRAAAHNDLQTGLPNEACLSVELDRTLGVCALFGGAAAMSEAENPTPTGMLIVIPSRLGVGEPFGIAVKLSGTLRKIPSAGGWCNVKPPRALIEAIDDLFAGGGR